MAADPEPSQIAIVCAATPTDLVLALRPLDAALRVIEGAGTAADRLRDPAVDVVVVEHGTGLDGLGLAAALRGEPDLEETPIILIVPAEGGPSRREGIAAGATDVVLAPYDAFDLQIRTRNLAALSLARRQAERQARSIHRVVNRAVAESAQREREIIRRLMLAAEYRDDQAGDHLTRVAGCVIAIAEGLGLSEADANDIALASTMHDIGKISIADDILMKAGPLTPAERDEMNQHALRGYQMLNDSPSHLLQLASEIALTHHERWDGTGYPQGLAGDEIPLSGRIIAVADVFDALISERVYKRAWPVDEARRHLEDNAGTHFDPACIAAFVSRWDDIVLLTQERPTVAATASAA
ncbi:phosphohydrolase [Methylobacterium sp. Leaf399]|uniref:HD-GYP domain-containing protein n=1 Tax=Methylobacterium sp. Leaf399 TaxID=1736364 RepID=UPI0006FA8D3B|nr:HD domain-containing phosphohydrolase [Methylobacterium sp. Leaf399]KQT09835.1 phosphohydrolase [Methylobacterium sp. Leaf399]